MSTNAFTIKRGDILPQLQATLKDAYGTPANLTGATIRFVMRARGAATAKVDNIASIVSATAGTVQYTWVAGDTDTAGAYLAEFEVTFPGGAVETFPNAAHIEIEVFTDLSTPPVATITNLSDVKAHLNIPSTDSSHDGELQRFIDAAAPVIEHICGPILPATYSESYDGGLEYIALRHTPIVSVTSVTEYWGPVAYTLSATANPAAGGAYNFTVELDTGRIVRRASGAAVPFAPGRGSVVVVYVAGRASVPANVQQAAKELVRHWYQQSQQGGRPSFSQSGALEDSSGSVPQGFAVPNRVRELLLPNKRAPSVA